MKFEDGVLKVMVEIGRNVIGRARLSQIRFGSACRELKKNAKKIQVTSGTGNATASFF